jgi:hypothetical protein
MSKNLKIGWTITPAKQPPTSLTFRRGRRRTAP